MPGVGQLISLLVVGQECKHWCAVHLWVIGRKFKTHGKVVGEERLVLDTCTTQLSYVGDTTNAVYVIVYLIAVGYTFFVGRQYAAADVLASVEPVLQCLPLMVQSLAPSVHPGNGSATKYSVSPFTI